MYRFDEIKGNQQVKNILQRGARTGRFSHAYIFQGAEGMGKKIIANAFAKALQCTQGEGEACGVCHGCKAFDSGNHPDVFYVLPHKTKNLGVEDIREQIVKNADIKQYEYPYKIFIIEHAEKMTIAAQNALLKTLEEPPEYVVFLLLAENMNGFLPTVLSRCAILKLQPVPKKEIESYLLGNGFAEESTASIFAEYAQGSIGQAVELATSEEFITMREDILSMLCKLKEQSIPSLLEKAKELEQYKNNLRFLEIASLWYRDVLVAKRLQESQYLIQKDKEKQIMSQARQDSLQGILNKLQVIQKTKSHLARNANFQLTMEVMLMKLKESYNT